MPWFSVIWTEENIQHLKDHGVSPEEFEQVVFPARKVDPNKEADTFEVIGETQSGRVLKCIFEYADDFMIYPLSAFDFP